MTNQAFNVYKDTTYIRMNILILLFLAGTSLLRAEMTNSLSAEGAFASWEGGSTEINYSINHPGNEMALENEFSATKAGNSVANNLLDDNLGCNDNIITVFSSDCFVLVTPDMILEGDFPDGISDDDFIVRVIGDDANEINETEDNIVNDAGEFQVLVLPRDPDVFPIRDWQGCEGAITVQDRQKPQLVNEYDTEVTKVKQTLKVQIADGEIGSAAKEGLVDISKYSCFGQMRPEEICERPYQTVTFKVNRTDFYILELDIEGAENGLLALFREMYNPEAPCENLLHQTNEKNEFRNNIISLPGNGEDGLIRMAVSLKANQKYVALITSDDCPDAMFVRQDYSLSLYTDGSGKAVSGFGSPENIEVYRNLLCDDVDQIWNRPESMDILIGSEEKGNPFFEDCTLERVWFRDGEVQENGSCGSVYFTRTWYAEDENGRSADPVVQTVRLRRPSMSDIFRPDKIVIVPAAELTPENLDANGNPLPALTGYPFVVSAFGANTIDEAYCNLGASYKDVSDIEVCGGIRKIVRQWTLVNWCDVPDQFGENYGLLLNYTQILKVGDFDPPQVQSMDDLVISTGLFECSAEWRVIPPVIEGGCDDCEIDVVIHRLEELSLLDRYGRATGEVEILEEVIAQAKVGDIIPGIEQFYRYRATYFVQDACNNLAEPVELIFSVEDKTEPVAVCDYALNLSLDGEGFSRITAEDVDEGSWDNCSEVSLYISRCLPDNDTRDIYLQRAYDLQFSDLNRENVQGPQGETEVWSRSDGKEILRKKDGQWCTWWAPELYILCNDEGSQVTIELLVVDGEGSVQSYWEGQNNGNTCSLKLNVEDEIPPTCIPPADVQLTCTDMPYGFDPLDDAQLEELFGVARAVDNCSGATTEQTRKVVTWNCGAGSIVRFFKATGNAGSESTNTCRQMITVLASHDYEIKFPKDAISDCSDVQPDTISFTENACDLLTLNVTDQRFQASGNACYKLYRTYKVINWCEYDGESSPIVIGRNEDCDSENGEDDIYVLVRGNGITYLDLDNNENVLPSTSPCGNGAQGHLTNSNLDRRVTSNGYWQYTQHIIIHDQTAPDIRQSGDNTFCTSSEDCLADVSLSVGIADLCSTEELNLEIFFLPDPMTGLSARIDLQEENNARLYEFEIEGDLPFINLKGRFPMGDHKLEISAMDGCLNATTKEIDFGVYDCLPPQPICINGLAIGLQPLDTPTDVDGDGDLDAGMAIIAASDFKLERMNECSEPIRRSINIVGETPNPDQTTLILTCDDLDTILVEIFVWDSAYNPNAEQPDGSMGGPNYAYCQTYVIVQDEQFNLCQPESPAGIAGLLITEEDETVENAEVHLSGKMSETKMTPAGGYYAFMGLPTGYDYSVTPIKDKDYLNGVSTYDLVLMTRHVLGTALLDSPYKMIAADVNNSGSITTIDLIYLRKLILGLRQDLPNTPSWRFVPTSYQFPTPENPWREAFPEVLSFNDVDRMVTVGDFIAIKMGDMNVNAKVNSLFNEERSVQGVFKLELEDQELEAGKEYRVSFTAEEFTKIQGYQFTMDFDLQALELIDIDYGIASEEHFGLMYVDEGILTTSWNGVDPSASNSSTVSELFSLVFRARTDAKLSELLKISSQFTQAEAYNDKDELMDVQLQFNESQALAESFELYQNQPNPFAESTLISFYLPRPGEATLTIHDVNGKALKVIRAAYQRGRQQISLSRHELHTSSGLLYYTLETGDFVETKKMLIID